MRDSNGVVSLGGAGSFHLNKEDIFESGCRGTKGILEEEEVKQGEGGSKPRTTDLRPWIWGAALTGRSEHSSPRLRTGRSVVRGKYCKYFGLRRVCKPFEHPRSLKLVKGGK